MQNLLKRLIEDNTEIRKDGFSISIEKQTPLWHECFIKLGVKQAYSLMAIHLNVLYHQRFNEDFLFSDECMAHEIAYHADAYMAVKGYQGYHRDVTTHLFSDEQIITHCKEIDISTLDVDNFKQRTMFQYKKGIRECYKHTDKNPFNKL